MANDSVESVSDMNLQQAGHPILVRVKLKLSMLDLSNIKPDRLGLGTSKRVDDVLAFHQISSR